MNINVTMPTKHQLAVLASHGVAIAGGALSALFFAGVLTQAQVTDATSDVNRIVADLKDLYGAVAGLATIAMVAYSTVKSGPFASFFRAATEINSDPKLLAQAQLASFDQKVAVVSITDKLPEVAGVATVNTRGGQALATAVPSSSVQVAK